jgi:hypothetical protein
MGRAFLVIHAGAGYAIETATCPAPAFSARQSTTFHGSRIF